MEPEYWQLGEDIQNRILAAGYQSSEVEGIAVDIHDLLQAVDVIRKDLAPKLLTVATQDLANAMAQLADELDHVRWHCDSAIEFLAAAQKQLA